MSLFFCPIAQRPLIRAALRGVSSRTARTREQAFAPSRWLTSCASHARHTGCFRQGSISQARCRSVAIAPGYPHGSRRTFFSDKTTRKYEDLPKDYRDQVGLPFRGLDLTESEVVHIFGPGTSTSAANYLLRILHGRRVAGTLEDPAFAVHTAQFTDDQISKALEYLRRTIPVNEVLNAGLRAEDELAQMELEMAAAEKQKKATANREKAEPAVKYEPDPVYGRSKLDEIRSRNVAKRKAEEARLEEERKAAEARGEVNSGTLADVKPAAREITNPRIREYYEKAQSPLEEAPEMKNWERVLPSATVVVLALGFLGAVAMVYEEPEPRFRLVREISTAQATVGTIIAINALVFCAWRVPPLWAVLNRWMIMVVGKVRPVTMFTAIFSQQQTYHLLINMVPLWFIGSAIHEEIGRANFIALYLACGSLGFLGSLITYTLRGWLTVSTMGASGATLGILSAYLWEHRNDGFKFFGLPENGVHGIVLLALTFIPQLAAFGKTAKYQIDLASHLVGMLTGILGIEYMNRDRENKDKKVIEVFTEDKMHPVASGKASDEAVQKRAAK